MVGAGAGGLGLLLYWLGRGVSSCAIGWRSCKKGKPPAAAPFPEARVFRSVPRGFPGTAVSGRSRRGPAEEVPAPARPLVS